MGNYRFKLSELIPNAWFYKLRDMGKPSRKQQRQQNITLSPSLIKKHHTVPTPTTTTACSPKLPPRRSSYYSRSDKTTPSDIPRKSARNRLRHRPTGSSAPKHVTSSSVCCRTNPQLDSSTTSRDSTATGTETFSPEFRSDQILIPGEPLESPWHSPCSCVSSKLSKAASFTPPLELDLRPIITKPAHKISTVRKTTVRSPAGVKLRLRSPRISTSSGARRSGSMAAAASSRRSRAVVKASVDPRRDFKESMEEMITENNISASKDLEELLACYLCLNSDEYHHIIINVFKQIWLDLNLPPT